MNNENRIRFKKLGLKIAYYRKLRGMTQEQLSERLGMSTAFIGQVEAPNMRKAVSLNTLFNIADALEIPAYRLLDFEDE